VLPQCAKRFNALVARQLWIKDVAEEISLQQKRGFTIAQLRRDASPPPSSSSSRC
jgi:hypothetical protein